ncbi:MFS transporter [Brevibacterium sp. UCMA 11754]|uniref:MFS transporter n=1 Tax=Brevibacterium sp. UCMA 11754 TaxID=2749198 RepID=UPI001F225564|nr:MFS transporter [Brevibacterium sp. UCMA 11754]MCF2573947.1 MFS transporter [Brevibacterium sp. UCMA 11754]
MDSREQQGPSRGMLTVLLGAVGAGPLLLYGLSAVSDSIIVDLGISEAQFGLLATACFTCAAIGNATLARVADRHSDMFLMTIVFALAAAALALVAVPAGFGMLLVAAALSGIAQSFPNGVTNRILLERVPVQKRIGWVGIKQSGVQVSQLVASVVFPLLAAAAGWRGAALVIALVPLVLMVMTWRALRAAPLLAETSAPVAEPDPGEPDPGNPDLAEAADVTAGPAAPVAPAPAASPRYPGMMWALAAFGLLNGIGVQATNVYMPLFSVRELDFPLVLGGVTAAVAGAIGVAARVGWARQMARGASGPRVLLLLALIAVAGAALFFAAGVTGWPWLLWIAAALHGTSALGVSVVLMSALMRSIPATAMASASGMVTAGMFTGFALGPVAMGVLVSSPGGFSLGWAVVGLVYLLCALLAVVLIRAANRAA